MKKLIRLPKILMLLLVFCATIVNAQTIVKSEEVTPAFLKETMENAAITVIETKDTYVKVKDVFDIYLDIDPSKRFISFSGSYPLVDGTSSAKALELMNKLNTDVIMVKSYYYPSSNTISCYYYFWIEGGFTKQNFLKAFKMMNPAINLILQKDVDKIIK